MFYRNKKNIKYVLNNYAQRHVQTATGHKLTAADCSTHSDQRRRRFDDESCVLRESQQHPVREDRQTACRDKVG